MTTITASKARTKFSKLLDQVARTYKPIKIRGKRNNAILVSERTWKGIQETLYLYSIPGMRESLLEGLKAPIHKTRKDLF